MKPARVVTCPGCKLLAGVFEECRIAEHAVRGKRCSGSGAGIAARIVWQMAVLNGRGVLVGAVPR